jgi:gamma-glutamyl-gamma-aminobutyrate hydrolase PuuD
LSKKLPTIDIPDLIVGVTKPTLGAENIFTKEDGYQVVILRPGEELPDHIDILCLTGGEDISPQLYGEGRCPETHPSESRDNFDMLVHKKYSMAAKLGICRGAQFLCAWNGGRLWQDIPEHNSGLHMVRDMFTNKLSKVNSVHHQACRPPDHALVIAQTTNTVPWVKDQSAKAYMPRYIVEAFFIPDDNALCVQWHPEFGHLESKEYFFELVERYIKPDEMRLALMTQQENANNNRAVG